MPLERISLMTHPQCGTQLARTQRKHVQVVGELIDDRWRKHIHQRSTLPLEPPEQRAVERRVMPYAYDGIRAVFDRPRHFRVLVAAEFRSIRLDFNSVEKKRIVAAM